MFKRKYSLLFPLIVFVAFLFFSNTTNEASPDPHQSKEDIIAITEAGPGIADEEVKKQKLAEKIVQDYAELETIFESEDSPGNKMAKILGKKAILVVGSQTHYGKHQIRNFWNSIKDDYQSVVFTLDSAIIVYEEMEEMEEYDHIAYEFFTFKLIDQQAGIILKNQDGRGGRSCRHIHGCDCRTR